ncbi:MAG: carbon-nitrogen family hydrolase, partial [Armatimonadota bacterium]|nr:carbon-nitrogen family hydrolase [Armatimonadota bacterium]
MQIIGCQLNTEWENKAANYAQAQMLIERAMPDEGALVVLPEMFATGFSMNVQTISDSDSRETAMFLAAMASKYKVYLLGGLVTVGADGRGRNEAAVFAPDGREIARYCKLHPFSFGAEAQHYSGGCEIVTFNWGDFVVAPFICYDLRFPEIFRAAVQRGVQLFTVIANWPAVREE